MSDEVENDDFPYSYFVSYSYQDAVGSGFGNIPMGSRHIWQRIEDIREVEKVITAKYGYAKTVVTGWQLLKASSDAEPSELVERLTREIAGWEKERDNRKADDEYSIDRYNGILHGLFIARKWIEGEQP